MKCYYLGYRVENGDTTFEEWCQYAEEEDYLWGYVIVVFGGDSTPCISTDRTILENRKQQMESLYPEAVYKIFEFNLE